MPIKTSRAGSRGCRNNPASTSIPTRRRDAYVGKASVLRDRVRSYLGAQGMSPRIDALLDEAAQLEFIVTDSVVEALALENHLIKQRAPKYNILLRDDKNYPYLQLTTGETFPRVLIARSVEKDDHYYAGPVHAREARPPDHGADPPAVRHAVLQRGHHRRTGAAVPRVRHPPLHRAVRARDLQRGDLRGGGAAHAALSRRAATTSSSRS
jgi:hypothetical protein